MWIKDMDGDLINLDKVSRIYVDRDDDAKPEVDEYVVWATVSYGSDYYRLFGGTKESCRGRVEIIAQAMDYKHTLLVV